MILRLQTHDILSLGVEFALNHWWVTGGLGGPQGSSNLIYEFTREGTLVNTLQATRP